jgi:HEAT repeat protein
VLLLSITSRRQEEPFYHGRSLTAWLDDYYVDSRHTIENDSPQTEAYFAIRSIGTNALPTLLNWVEHEAPEWAERVRSIAEKAPLAIANSRLVNRLTSYGRRPYFWQQAFAVLGWRANCAIPELTRIMNKSPDEHARNSAAIALSLIRPAGLVPLKNASPDPHAKCQTTDMELPASVMEIDSVR